MAKFRGIRGMRDLLPAETRFWREMEGQVQQQLHNFGYQEIRLPILESTELFVRSAGVATDLVNKEMYTFADRNGDSMTLRPEGTAGCLRAAIEHGLVANRISRLWYTGSMFRYERPQKGRYRQFSQIGVEAIGDSGPDLDLELLELSWRIWQALGITDLVTLEINSLGTAASRQEYCGALVDYLNQHKSELDPISRQRLSLNPLRILDSKVPATQAVLEDAPIILDFLDEDSGNHFAALCRLLEGLDIPFVVNPRIVRGLDYYTKTAFEWVSDHLGSQNAVCAGGRYDALSGLLGGPAVPAAGFAIGMDRLALILRSLNEEGYLETTQADVYLLALGEALRPQLLQLAARLRVAMPDKRIVCHLGQSKIKTAMKQADRSGAMVALLLGEDELAAGAVALKPLRGQFAQRLVPLDKLEEQVRAVLDQVGLVID